MTHSEIIAIWRTISRLETCLAILVGAKGQRDGFSMTGYWDEIAAVEEILKKELEKVEAK